jgi:hypothetical protein
MFQYYQHDNAPVHSTKLLWQFLAEHNILWDSFQTHQLQLPTTFFISLKTLPWKKKSIPKGINLPSLQEQYTTFHSFSVDTFQPGLIQNSYMIRKTQLTRCYLWLTYRWSNYCNRQVSTFFQ